MCIKSRWNALSSALSHAIFLLLIIQTASIGFTPKRITGIGKQQEFLEKFCAIHAQDLSFPSGNCRGFLVLSKFVVSIVCFYHKLSLVVILF